MKVPVYLDYNATTPTDPRVVERMLPYFTDHFGNPSSSAHPYGWTAAEAVKQAREQIAEALGAQATEITFTSGSTEAINMAIKGIAEAYAEKGRHVITVQNEHKAVLDACGALERQGWTVTRLPVDADGVVSPDAVAEALTDETVLVAVMWANNETGVLQPMEAIAEIVRPRGALLLTDATQAVGKVPVSVEHVDLLVCSGHKCYGPKGVGALYMRRRAPRVHCYPLLDGGGQERGLRGGTLNVPGIVGLGAAMAIAVDEQPSEAARLQALRDRMEEALLAALPDLHIVGRGADRLPNTSSMTFRGAKNLNLMMGMRDLAVSPGSACSSGSGAGSHVLLASGLTPADAQASLRFSLGRFTTAEEIDFTIERVIAAAQGAGLALRDAEPAS